ncbi:MAG: cytochrome C oxidase subunit IV family protein [Chloroflexota bacterium]
MPPRDKAKPRAYWRGFLTILVLGVLTGFEFRISSDPIWPLILIGLVKAGLILQFFMHITRVWKPE